MKTLEWMKLISLSLKDLADAIEVYDKAEREMKNGAKSWQVYKPNYYSKEAIKRRITQIRQDLLLLEKEL